MKVEIYTKKQIQEMINEAAFKLRQELWIEVDKMRAKILFLEELIRAEGYNKLKKEMGK